jgi:hypothetical protein
LDCPGQAGDDTRRSTLSQSTVKNPELPDLSGELGEFRQLILPEFAVSGSIFLQIRI